MSSGAIRKMLKDKTDDKLGPESLILQLEAQTLQKVKGNAVLKHQ